jgi:hypothetical protein
LNHIPIIIIIVIIIIINCSCGFHVVAAVNLQYTILKIATKFTSGGLHEKHAVATCSVGNHLSICF